MLFIFFFFFKQKTAYEIGTGDWSSDVCSSDLHIERQNFVQTVAGCNIRCKNRTTRRTGFNQPNREISRTFEADDPTADLSRPYPFYLAYQLDGVPDDLGAPEAWGAEHKWDGIRGQVILRQGQHFVWSRGEELMTDRFPELAALADFVPSGTVLDGELLAWNHDTDAPLSFNALQKRIGRKTVPKKLLADAPVVLRAYDVLEWKGDDVRARAFSERRDILKGVMRNVPRDAPLRLSPLLSFDDWEDLATMRAGSRAIGAEGVMLKRLDSPYRQGRKKGDWWKWKVDPLVVDAVMIYAQAGHGRRANLFTDRKSVV